jgi:PPOX class probable F420-dependent enzyme
MPDRLNDKDIALLSEAQIAAVATHNRDGSIQLTPVWVDTDGEAVLFNTAKGRVKHRNLEANPNVSILVVDKDDPYRFVAVSGKAELVDEGADEHIDKLANKYLGVDSYPNRTPEEVRVIVRVAPEHKLPR